MNGLGNLFEKLYSCNIAIKAVKNHKTPQKFSLVSPCKFYKKFAKMRITELNFLLFLDTPVSL